MTVVNGKIPPRIGKKLGLSGDGDLQQVFQYGQMNHMWYFLTAPINMWAKFKPFRHPGYAIYSGHFTDANGVATPNSDRYAGARQANYGLVPPDNAVSEYPADVYNKLWSYARCRENIDPMSAQDFENYNHNAVPPIMPMDRNAALPMGSYINYYPAFQQQGIDFGLIERGPQDDMIAIEDFADLDGWYVCVLLCDSSTYSSSSHWKWKTASSPIVLNTSGYASSVPCPLLTHNDIMSLQSYKYYYLCVADTKYDDWSQLSTRTNFKPLPAGSLVDLKGYINVSTQVVSQMTILEASFVRNPLNAGSYDDITTYTGPGDTYYDVNGHYYVALKVRVKAPSTNSITIQASSLKMSLSNTFCGGSPSNLTVSLKDSSYNDTDNIPIAAGATEEFYIICGDQALAIDYRGHEAMPTVTGLEIEVLFTFSHNGITFSNDQFIRLTNP